MIKEITVAGVKLNNYTALENLTHLGKRVEEKAFTVVEDVYMGTLLLAQEDETVKMVLEQADITVISEVNILDAVGETTFFHKHEIEKSEFFFQFMRILERRSAAICLLGADQKELDQVLEYLSSEFPRLHIISTKVLDVEETEVEKLINEINLTAPDTIISVLPSPLQEHFLAKNRSMLFAKIWYGMGSGRMEGRKHRLKYFLIKKIREHKLLRYVKGYKESNNE